MTQSVNPLRIDGVRLTTCRAEFIRHDDPVSWKRAAEFALWCQRNSPWWLGDIIVLGEERIGDQFWTSVSMNGASFDALERWRAVASKVPPDMRNPALSWTHHAMTANLSPEIRRRVLAEAELDCLSSGDIQKRVREIRSVDRD